MTDGGNKRPVTAKAWQSWHSSARYLWLGAGDAVLRCGERIDTLIGPSRRAKTWLADKSEYHGGVATSKRTHATMPSFTRPTS